MNALTGWRQLTRLALRRDRFTLPAWILGLAGFTAATTAMSVNGFPTQADLLQATEMMAASPGMRLLGLASGATVGGYAMIRDFVTLAVLAALMNTFAVVRHTRQSEENGRVELVGAAAVGRQAALACALAVAVATDVLLAMSIGLAMISAGQPALGSFTAGAAVGAVGLVFAGIAAICVQLATTSRGASGLAAAGLGVAFLASGVGNMAGQVDQSGLRVESAWPAWLSPIGWGQQMRPFGGDHWWPLGLAVASFVICVAVAARLAARRDFGQGLVPQRLGHAGAGPLLGRPWGLALRLQRDTLIGWSIGMAGFGLVLGGIIDEMKDISGAGRDWYVRMGGTEQMLDAFRASMIEMAGMAVAIYTVQVLLRLRSEEAEGQLESVLATAVGRVRWTLGHAASVVGGAVALLMLFAIGMGIAAGAVLGDPGGQVRTLVAASLVQLPGILMVGAVVILAVGWLPRQAAVVSWAFLMVSILTGPLFGPTTLRLPQWAQNISPFTHLPKAPAAPVSAIPMLVMIAIVAATAGLGLLALRRRNVVLPA